MVSTISFFRELVESYTDLLLIKKCLQRLKFVDLPMQEPVRLGQTVIYLEEKLEKIEYKLNLLPQYEGYQDFHGDPFEVTPWSCTSCGTKPVRRRKKNGKWEYACSSCEKTAVGKDTWEAILRWNRSNSSTKTLEEIPFRAVRESSPDQQAGILNYLCEYYNLKKKQAGLNRQIAQLTDDRPPGKTYQKRLTAFYEWALLGREIHKSSAFTAAEETVVLQR